jgi:hypothetical protein
MRDNDITRETVASALRHQELQAALRERDL